MKEFRPYKDKSNEWMIDQLEIVESNKGLLYYICIGAAIIALLWLYLRIAFWITMCLLAVFMFIEITELIFEKKKSKKDYLKHELKLRIRED